MCSEPVDHGVVGVCVVHLRGSVAGRPGWAWWVLPCVPCWCLSSCSPAVSSRSVLLSSPPSLPVALLPASVGLSSRSPVLCSPVCPVAAAFPHCPAPCPLCPVTCLCPCLCPCRLLVSSATPSLPVCLLASACLPWYSNTTQGNFSAHPPWRGVIRLFVHRTLAVCLLACLSPGVA